MFDGIEKKFLRRKDETLLEQLMKSSLPQIYNALFPTLTSSLIETRIEVQDMHNNLEKWVAKHPDIVESQRDAFRIMFNKFLLKATELKHRAERLEQQLNARHDSD